jgi:hypothetical protein
VKLTAFSSATENFGSYDKATQFGWENWTGGWLEIDQKENSGENEHARWFKTKNRTTWHTLNEIELNKAAKPRKKIGQTDGERTRPEKISLFHSIHNPPQFFPPCTAPLSYTFTPTVMYETFPPKNSPELKRECFLTN